MRKTLLFVSLFAGFIIRLLSASPETAFENLARELESPNPAQRLEAVRKIAVDYTVEGQPYILKAAGDRDEFVRERAVQGLGAGGGAKAVAALKMALKDPDEFVRWRSVQALDRLGVQDVIEELAPLIRDESWRVKVSALELLGNIGVRRMKRNPSELPGTTLDKRLKQILLQGLEDPDERVRLSAAASLARNKDGAAMAPLRDLLRNGSMFTRGSAGEALGDLSDTRAVESLIEALADPRNHVCEEGSDWACWGAAKALTKLTGQNYGIDVKKWREWSDSNLPK
ncbi:MAG TPA: HEAT repeat domain-containing protein [archaeon]|nr:HEAT repeat domain-containing protein [archaeon]